MLSIIVIISTSPILQLSSYEPELISTVLSDFNIQGDGGHCIPTPSNNFLLAERIAKVTQRERFSFLYFTLTLLGQKKKY